MPLKAWVKQALDRVLEVCFRAPDIEFCWVGDDAVVPLAQAQICLISLKSEFFLFRTRSHRLRASGPSIR